ncbi:hypothetical protein BCR33DRAFT_712468 [Rhizoclosmatium globosum]|uniref:Uncharacterized protein n=1 Tax=Rhizoclosmatium globosum TaxID=329046 RepID=A0A1Y2CWP7_9FUNG|nr:hypothetical protein BCR33DRAFT_712468 [Rhizoclosmatium globosum]|eukprot:ORY51407.1 hypothetical protein BCR33DRAFT_712468 [Rhizoclosmatium globosum]
MKLTACLSVVASLLASTALAVPAGPITKFQFVESAGVAQFRISTDTTETLLSILADNTLRVQTVPAGGEFVEPTKPSIVVKKSWEKLAVESKQSDKDIVVSWANENGYKIHINKAPFKIAVKSPKGIVYEESAPIDITPEKTSQFLSHGVEEQFFGGGMQNGRFTHKFTKIRIERSEDWDDGGTPNAAPFYMSNNGYGVFRNTFAPGTYDFTSTHQPVVTTHNESRFDAYIFLADSLKGILNGYTLVTGRPFLPPMYGLEMGDSDCYLHNANRGERRTLSWTTDVANGYIENDMPVGWLLVNDGYGCGYEDLPETAQMLSERDITMGLWTEFDLTNQPYEVQEGQVRVRKLDVAWIGSGYEFALNGCEVAYQGIEDYSDARGFVWTVEGWAGTQRCAVQWSGDQKGSWDNIRFHIPTLAGSGLSGQAWTSGDIDGIWTGSAETYVRDLQFKVFAPVVMSMSGWAPYDKQPWRHGEPYTSINRKYLKLRESLLPYFYTYAAEAYFTGVPPVRSLVLEYPNDPITWTNAVQHQFLFGTQFLVAPVFTDTTVRSGIYLPEGTWYNYWNGDKYHGNQVLNNFPAPFDTLPLFIKSGSIIPMWGNVNSFKHVKKTDDLIVDIYPAAGETSEFSLYEDDMVTRKHRTGEFSYQNFTMTATETKIQFTIGEVVGHYDGKPDARGYRIKVHADLAWMASHEVHCNFEHTLEKDTVILVRVPRLPVGTSAQVVLNMRPRANFVMQE